MAVINGKVDNEINGLSLAQIISKKGYFSDRIAVELNCEIVRKDRFDDVIISEDDKIEVVNFVGGG